MVARRGHARLFLIKFYRAVNRIYRAMKSKYRGINEKYCAINGKLVRSHVIGCHARCFCGRDDNGCNSWGGMFWGQWFVLFSWKDHWAVLCNTTSTHSSVNQYSKPWFCKILRNTFGDGCQLPRTIVDYLTLLITLQVCKFLDVTSASPTPLRKTFQLLWPLSSRPRTQSAWQPITCDLTSFPFIIYGAIIFYLMRDNFHISRDNFSFIARYFDFIAR